MSNYNEISELLKSYNASKSMPPEHEEYEDAYTLALDEALPVKYILAGMTKPFPAYKNKRPATKKHYLFEHVISGKGYIFIRNKWYELNAGDTFILGKDDDRNFYSDVIDPMCKIYVSFASEYVDAMMFHYGVLSGVYKMGAQGCFEDIYNTVRSCGMTQSEKIFSISENIHKIIMLAAKSNQNTVTLAGKIEARLLGSICEKVSLDDIAEELFISKSTMIRAFKRAKGITPYSFLLNERIKVAKVLFSTTGLSVKAVAEKLCFADEHYFSHIFSEKVGAPPLKYKAKTKLQ